MRVCCQCGGWVTMAYLSMQIPQVKEMKRFSKRISLTAPAVPHLLYSHLYICANLTFMLSALC